MQDLKLKNLDYTRRITALEEKNKKFEEERHLVASRPGLCGKNRSRNNGG